MVGDRDRDRQAGRQTCRETGQTETGKDTAIDKRQKD